MEFTRASVRVQLIVQKYLKPPFLIKFLSSQLQRVDLEGDVEAQFEGLQVHRNPRHCRVGSRKYPWNVSHTRFLWILFGHNLSFVVLICIARILWVLSNWERFKDFEQIGCLTLGGTVCCVAKAAHAAVDSNVEEICFLLTQELQLVTSGRGYASSGQS